MAGKLDRDRVDGVHSPRRAHERLASKKRWPQGSSGGWPAEPGTILEHITEGFLFLDQELRCTYVNRAAAAMLETTRECLLGKAIREMSPRVCDSRLYEECRRAVAQQAAAEFESHFESLDRWCVCHCCPVDEGLAVFLLDITELRRTQEALRENECAVRHHRTEVANEKKLETELRRRIERLEKDVRTRTEETRATIDRLQGAMRELQQRAHQLQKLALELSQAEDRERKRLAEILHDDLQQVLAAAKFHLGMLNSRTRNDAVLQELCGQIGTLLKEAISKSRSLSHELSPAVLYQSDLAETFEWLASQLQAQHGLVVHVEARGQIDPRSEPLRIFLYKAAREMLFNVVKHAGVMEARLRLQKVRERVWLTISDKGRGFDVGVPGKLGGFGLMSIRERVQLLGGRMKIRSAAGRGSTFLISVPDGEIALAEATAAPVAAHATEESPETRPRLDEQPSHCLRVLLVDDHEVVRQGLAALLASERDIDVVGQAANGREAIEMAGNLQPDVVVMDVAMPVMAGDEATRRIRQRFPGIRVIALSMFQETAVAERMRKAGAAAHLLKTAPSEELLAAIRGAVSVKRNGRS